jgi:glycosyltransferase 2 family protein
VVSILYGAVYFIIGAIGGVVWIFSAEKGAGAMMVAATAED